MSQRWAGRLQPGPRHVRSLACSSLRSPAGMYRSVESMPITASSIGSIATRVQCVVWATRCVASSGASEPQPAKAQ